MEKRAKKGFRGHPIGTVAFYGPDERCASKVVAAIVPREGAEPSELQKWFASNLDVRVDPRVGKEVTAFLRQHGARTVVRTLSGPVGGGVLLHATAMVLARIF